jgi:hypothetical protein
MEEARQALLLAEKGGVSLEDLRSLWATATKCTETEEELVTLYTTYIYMTRRYIAASGIIFRDFT